jgi:sulfonate transport system ATP-binding protein
VTNAPLLSVKNAAFGYQSPIFSGLSFDVSPGEVVVLMGSSGCGKSTLLKALAAQFQLTSGTIEYTIDPLRDIGFLYQQPYAFPWMSALENLMTVAGIGGTEARRSLKSFQLDDASSLYPYQLSGGMLRRLGLLMALCGPQPLALLDEPFSGLDDWNKGLAFQAVESAAKESGKGILLTTHSFEEAAVIGDRILAFGGQPAKFLMNEVVKQSRPRFDEFGNSVDALHNAARLRKSLFALEADNASV